MNYISAKTPPVREERLGAGIAFGGTCREVQCARAGGCLNLAGRAFSQTQGCQFTLSQAIINTLRNAVIIMHGPIGCGASSIGAVGTSQTFKRLRDPNAEGLIWLNSNLDEADVIGGGENKLKEAIRFAERMFRPETILIPVSCVPALIGDDVDAVVAEMQEETAAVLVPVHCSGFKTKVMATAYDDVYHGILRTLVKKPERRADRRVAPDELEEMRRRYRDSRTVNILNVSSMSRPDETELTRLLNALDLQVRFLPCYSDAEDFQYALESALNVSICGTHDDYFLRHLQTLYDIPFLIDTIPIGRKNTARWLRKIAAHFDLSQEANRLIASEEQALDRALAPFRPALRGKTAFLGGGEVRILATAEILQDLGLEIVGFKGHHYDEFAEPVFESLDNIDDVLFNVATQQPFEQINLVKRLRPDLYVGHTGGGNISAKQGLPLLPLFGPSYNYMGFSGVFEVARRIRRILANAQFNKQLARHCPLPYRDSWYAQSPFAYIKAEG
ncbi:MAG: nitrogenase [Oscillospiraceae bacterium]|nr:nitrogenase [Oscillospiraceae bacterium]